MQRFFVIASVVTVAAAGFGFAACSSSSSNAVSPAGTDAGHDTGGGAHDSAVPGNDTGATDTGTPDMGTTPEASTDAEADAGGDGGNVTLKVLNYKKWCSVTINGGTASTNATITNSVPAGSTATIVATPASANFVIGADPWFGVNQNDGGAAPGVDQGTGTTETSTAMVTVTANHCVSVCCGDKPNGTNCPATDPCP